jgi:hypothetical protein
MRLSLSGIERVGLVDLLRRGRGLEVMRGIEREEER